MAKDELVDTLPTGICCYALNNLSTPIAVKDVHGRFIWANRAYEEMLDFSLAELRVRRWQDVTYQEDIGGELANVEAIAQGQVNCFTFHKTYRTKSGNPVKRQTRFWRWPKDNAREVELLIVEATTEACTMEDLRDFARSINDKVDRVEAMVKKSGGNRRDTMIGNVANSDSAVKFLIVGAMFLICAIMFLSYYLFAKPGQVAPPSVPTVTIPQ